MNREIEERKRTEWQRREREIDNKELLKEQRLQAIIRDRKKEDERKIKGNYDQKEDKRRKQDIKYKVQLYYEYMSIEESRKKGLRKGEAKWDLDTVD